MYVNVIIFFQINIQCYNVYLTNLNRGEKILRRRKNNINKQKIRVWPPVGGYLKETSFILRGKSKTKGEEEKRRIKKKERPQRRKGKEGAHSLFNVQSALPPFSGEYLCCVCVYASLQKAKLLQTTKKESLYTGLFLIHQNKHLVTRWFTQFNIVCLWGVFSFVCLCSTSSSSTFLASEADFKTAVIFIWAKF